MRESIKSIVKLRIVVGYLGEKGQKNWWGSSFLASYAKSHLVHLYPRTLLLAQYRGVTEAASLVHDEFIGVGSNYHLYRLPETVEQDADAWVRKGDQEMFAPVLSDIDAALGALSELAGPGASAQEGPVMVCAYHDAALEVFVEQSAALYLAAMQSGGRCYPFMRGAA